ncbi:MAG: GtrA family protein [Oceanipulchritudo sp.]
MKRLIRHYLHSHTHFAQFMRFSTVAVKVSLIDAGILYLLTYLVGFNVYFARVLSLSSAIVVGYLLHRYFTFGGFQRGCFYRQMAGHLGVHLTGGTINYLVFSALITLGHRALENKVLLSVLPLVCLWVGGVAGLTFNFICSKTFVFRARKHKLGATS